MTGLQYKNTIAKALNELSGTNDSIAVAKEILNSCGAEFPYGELEGILRTFSSDEFTCWRTCTYEDAQKFANEGIPVVGVSSKSIFVIEPEDSAVSGEDVVDVPSNASEFIRQASSMPPDECTDMHFFYYSGTPTTILSIDMGSVSNVPSTMTGDGFGGWYNPAPRCLNQGIRDRIPRFVQYNRWGPCVAYSIMMGHYYLYFRTSHPNATTWFTNNVGTYLDSGGATGTAYGFVNRINYSISTLRSQLNSGKPVTISGKNSGGTNHMALAVAYIGNGVCESQFVVVDPYRDVANTVAPFFTTFAEFKNRFPNDGTNWIRNENGVFLTNPMFTFK
jgi:hypothetical protein